MNIGERSPTMKAWLMILFLAGMPGALDPPPQGNNGIAAQYPGDAGIGSDPAVLFIREF